MSLTARIINSCTQLIIAENYFITLSNSGVVKFGENFILVICLKFFIGSIYDELGLIFNLILQIKTVICLSVFILLP